MLLMRVFKVVDEKEEMEHEIKKFLKDETRGTEERVSMTSTSKITFETNCETNDYFHLFINTEMLVIAARTHAV